MSTTAAGPRGDSRPGTRKPPWWRWYEPPRWFPGWLHLLTCTHCRTLARFYRKQARGKVTVHGG